VNESNFFLSAAIASIDSEPIGLLVWATIGGVLVFFGLIFEKIADWMDERFLGGWKPHKTFGNVGWSILMVGIAIEIADAGFAAIEGWQTRQIAIKNNPINQPVVNVAATLELSINATQELTTNRCALLYLCGKSITGWSQFPALIANDVRDLGVPANVHLVATLAGKIISKSPPVDKNIKFVEAQFSVDPLFLNHFRSSKKAGEIGEVKYVSIWALFLPEGSEILGGKLTVCVNDLILKEFSFPPQKVSSSGGVCNILGVDANETNLPINIPK
jgi:hypothetical protein